MNPKLVRAVLQCVVWVIITLALAFRGSWWAYLAGTLAASSCTGLMYGLWVRGERWREFAMHLRYMSRMDSKINRVQDNIRKFEQLEWRSEVAKRRGGA